MVLSRIRKNIRNTLFAEATLLSVIISLLVWGLLAGMNRTSAIWHALIGLAAFWLLMMLGALWISLRRRRHLRNRIKAEGGSNPDLERFTVLSKGIAASENWLFVYRGNTYVPYARKNIVSISPNKRTVTMRMSDSRVITVSTGKGYEPLLNWFQNTQA